MTGPDAGDAHSVWTYADELLHPRGPGGKFAKKGTADVKLRSGAVVSGVHFDDKGNGHVYLGSGLHTHYHPDGTSTTHTHAGTPDPADKGNYPHFHSEGTGSQVEANKVIAHPTPPAAPIAPEAAGEPIFAPGTEWTPGLYQATNGNASLEIFEDGSGLVTPADGTKPFTLTSEAIGNISSNAWVPDDDGALGEPAVPLEDALAAATAGKPHPTEFHVPTKPHSKEGGFANSHNDLTVDTSVGMVEEGDIWIKDGTAAYLITSVEQSDGDGGAGVLLSGVPINDASGSPRNTEPIPLVSADVADLDDFQLAIISSASPDYPLDAAEVSQFIGSGSDEGGLTGLGKFNGPGIYKGVGDSIVLKVYSDGSGAVFMKAGGVWNFQADYTPAAVSDIFAADTNHWTFDQGMTDSGELGSLEKAVSHAAPGHYAAIPDVQEGFTVHPDGSATWDDGTPMLAGYVDTAVGSKTPEPAKMPTFEGQPVLAGDHYAKPGAGQLGPWSLSISDDGSGTLTTPGGSVSEIPPETVQAQLDAGAWTKTSSGPKPVPKLSDPDSPAGVYGSVNQGVGGKVVKYGPNSYALMKENGTTGPKFGTLGASAPNWTYEGSLATHGITGEAAKPAAGDESYPPGQYLFPTGDSVTINADGTASGTAGGHPIDLTLDKAKVLINSAQVSGGVTHYPIAAPAKVKPAAKPAAPSYVPPPHPPSSYEKVYKHPQGGTIYASSAGIEAFDVHGKKKSTSATAEKLAYGHGKWIEVPSTNWAVPHPDMQPAVVPGSYKAGNLRLNVAEDGSATYINSLGKSQHWSAAKTKTALAKGQWELVPEPEALPPGVETELMNNAPEMPDVEKAPAGDYLLSGHHFVVGGAGYGTFWEGPQKGTSLPPDSVAALYAEGALKAKPTASSVAPGIYVTHSGHLLAVHEDGHGATLTGPAPGSTMTADEVSTLHAGGMLDKAQVHPTYVAVPGETWTGPITMGGTDNLPSAEGGMWTLKVEDDGSGTLSYSTGSQKQAISPASVQKMVTEFPGAHVVDVQPSASAGPGFAALHAGETWVNVDMGQKLIIKPDGSGGTFYGVAAPDGDKIDAETVGYATEGPGWAKVGSPLHPTDPLPDVGPPPHPMTGKYHSDSFGGVGGVDVEVHPDGSVTAQYTSNPAPTTFPAGSSSADTWLEGGNLGTTIPKVSGGVPADSGLTGWVVGPTKGVAELVVGDHIAVPSISGEGPDENVATITAVELDASGIPETIMASWDENGTAMDANVLEALGTDEDVATLVKQGGYVPGVYTITGAPQPNLNGLQLQINPDGSGAWLYSQHIDENGTPFMANDQPLNADQVEAVMMASAGGTYPFDKDPSTGKAASTAAKYVALDNGDTLIIHTDGTGSVIDLSSGTVVNELNAGDTTMVLAEEANPYIHPDPVEAQAKLDAALAKGSLASDVGALLDAAEAGPKGDATPEPAGAPAELVELAQMLDYPADYPWPIVAGAPPATALAAPKQIKGASLRAGDVISLKIGGAGAPINVSVVKTKHKGGTTEVWFLSPGDQQSHFTLYNEETATAIARTPHPQITAQAKKAKAALAGGTWKLDAPEPAAAAPATTHAAGNYVGPSGTQFLEVLPDGTGIVSGEGVTAPTAISVQGVDVMLADGTWKPKPPSITPSGPVLADKTVAGVKPKPWTSSILKAGQTVLLPKGGSMVLTGPPKYEAGKWVMHGTPSKDAHPDYLNETDATLTSLEVSEVPFIPKVLFQKSGAYKSWAAPTPVLPDVPPVPSASAQLAGTLPPPPTTDTIGWKQVGTQAGSNLGGLFESPAGTRYYVKKPGSSGGMVSGQLRVENEVLAARLYAAAGVKVPSVQFAKLEPSVLGGGSGLASTLVEGKKNLATAYKDPAYRAQLYDDFAVHAWLGNWDAVGTGKDNIIQGTDGKPVMVDAGGSMLFRAMGTPKSSTEWGPNVVEDTTLRKHPQGYAKDANDVFGPMTDAQVKASVLKHIAPLLPAQIDAMVKSTMTSDPKVAGELAETLKARRLDLLKRYKITPPETVAAKVATVNVPGGVPLPAKGKEVNSEQVQIGPKELWFHTTTIGANSVTPGAVLFLDDDPSAPYVVTTVKPKEKGAPTPKGPASDAGAGKMGLWGKKNGVGEEMFLLVNQPSSGERPVRVQTEAPAGWAPPPPPPPAVPGVKLVPRKSKPGALGSTPKESQAVASMNASGSTSKSLASAFKRATPDMLAQLSAVGLGSASAFAQHFAQLSSNWNGSCASHTNVLAMHHAVAMEFGLDDVPPWPNEIKNMNTKSQVAKYYAKWGKAYQAAARLIWMETQEQLKAKGVDYLAVSRGFGFVAPDSPGAGQSSVHNFGGDVPAPPWAWTNGQHTDVTLRPLSSFSFSHAIGSTTVTAVVPRELIFSLSATGFGTSGETEIVVLGVKGAEWKLQGAKGPKTAGFTAQKYHQMFPEWNPGSYQLKKGEVAMNVYPCIATEDYHKQFMPWPFTDEEGDDVDTFAEFCDLFPTVDPFGLLGLPVGVQMPAKLRAELTEMQAAADYEPATDMVGEDDMRYPVEARPVVDETRDETKALEPEAADLHEWVGLV